MTTFAQVSALVKAHVSRDHDRFRAITLQIASHSSPQCSLELRRIIERQQATALVLPPSAAGLLSMPNAPATFNDMVLAPQIRARLESVLVEHERRFDLLAHGLQPARKLLFSGPAGTGKTMSAGAIASSLKMPLFRVELHGVISSFLGETASKLAKVFDHVRSMPGVYLFDEFDALGGNRSAMGGESAGNEMRRVVNSLLQFIEDDRSDSVIIAATNFGGGLDPAIYRRFDEMITFETLGLDELTTLVKRSVSAEIDYAAVHEVNPTLGHADLCAVLDRVRKDHVLTGAAIDTQAVVNGIARRMRS